MKDLLAVVLSTALVVVTSLVLWAALAGVAALFVMSVQKFLGWMS